MRRKKKNINFESLAAKRVLKELKEIQLDPHPLFTANVVDDNLFTWEAKIKGPLNTPYEGGTFCLSVMYPEGYPFKPPKIKFLTKIYHCNISSKGNICMDILKDNWNPSLTISKVLLSIISLLSSPNPEDPLVSAIAQEYSHRREYHDRMAREWTIKYASNK